MHSGYIYIYLKKIPTDKSSTHLTPADTITVAIILLGSDVGLDQGINYWNEET